MGEHKDREHYIPLSRRDVIELLCCHDLMPADQREQFRQFCTLVTATYHFEYHHLLEELKEAYFPFDPDKVTVPLSQPAAEERARKLDSFFVRFTRLMERANFKRLDPESIKLATRDVSAWGLNMEVDFDVFERLELFARGDVMGTRTRRRWWKLGPLETHSVPVYQRLILIMKLRPHKRLGPDVNTADVYVKIFKDIPKIDLEMLLPGARLQMPGWTRLKLGSSLLSGLGFVLYRVVSDLFKIAQAGVGFLWGPVLALAGYGYKQWYGYQHTKTTYSLQLTQSLYFQNLDNNAGVLCHLLDEAEEQECREAILAYYYLWRLAGDEGWPAARLDDHIERELERRTGLKIDFEIEDAIDKLEKLQIVSRKDDRYCARPVTTALEILDRTWDNCFRYSNPEPEGSAVGGFSGYAA